MMSNEANQILEILEEFRQEVAETKKELLSLRTTIETCYQPEYRHSF